MEQKYSQATSEVLDQYKTKGVSIADLEKEVGVVAGGTITSINTLDRMVEELNKLDNDVKNVGLERYEGFKFYFVKAARELGLDSAKKQIVRDLSKLNGHKQNLERLTQRYYDMYDENRKEFEDYNTKIEKAGILLEFYDTTIVELNKKRNEKLTELGQQRQEAITKGTNNYLNVNSEIIKIDRDLRNIKSKLDTTSMKITASDRAIKVLNISGNRVQENIVRLQDAYLKVQEAIEVGKVMIKSDTSQCELMNKLLDTEKGRIVVLKDIKNIDGVQIETDKITNREVDYGSVIELEMEKGSQERENKIEMVRSSYVDEAKKILEKRKQIT